MNRKQMYIIIGAVIAICVVGSISGLMAKNAADEKKMNQQIALSLLSYIPVEFHMHIDCSSTLSFDWSCHSIEGDHGGGGGGAMPVVNNYANGSVFYATVTLTTPGVLTLQMYINDKLIFEDSTSSVGVPITGRWYSPFAAFFFLAMLI